jgi:microcystin-dependent protein
LHQDIQLADELAALRAAVEANRRADERRDEMIRLHSAPTGTVLAYAANTDQLPQGWLFCDGSPLPEGPLFDDLDSNLKGLYGRAPSGRSLTPNLQGRVIAGRDSVYHVGAAAGARQATLGTQHLPAHTHSGSTSPGLATGTMRSTHEPGGGQHPSHVPGYRANSAHHDLKDDLKNVWCGQAHYHTFTTNGGDVLSSTPAPIDIQQPTMFMRWIIKA